MRKEARQARARQGWVPPGPVPPGGEVPSEGETLDALCGHWKIFQLRKGHRYSTDDLLCAWHAWQTATEIGLTPRRILDLGTGIGSVGMMVAWKFPAAAVIGLEKQSQSAALARRSVRFNGIAERMRIEEGDLKDFRAATPFDLVTGSPPYWDPKSGRLSEAPQKAPCRFEEIGKIEDYCHAAARVLAPRGLFTLVFDGRQRQRALRAAEQAELVPVRLRTVVSREGDPPLLLLLGLAPRGAHPPAPEGNPLLLRDRAGIRSAEFRALRLAMGFPPGPR